MGSQRNQTESSRANEVVYPRNHINVVLGRIKIKYELGLLPIFPSIMNLLDFSKYIEDWLANHEERANNMPFKIHKITDEYN